MGIYNEAVKGIGIRLLWMLAQVAAYFEVWVWIAQRNRWVGRHPELTDFLAGMGLVALIATFALIGARLPQAKVSSSGNLIQLPIDPLSIGAAFLSIVFLTLYEMRHQGADAAPCIFFIVAGTGILAAAFHEHPERTGRILISLFSIAGMFMFACYEHELQRPSHTPGIPVDDLFFGGVWILLPCALGIWTAVHDAMSSKPVLLGLIVVTLASLAATFLLSMFALWLCMLVPIVAAGYRLMNYLESRSEVAANPLVEAT